MEKNVKKAFELAQEEVQEKEIANLKNIIKDLLQKKVNKEKEKNEIEKDIKIIKQTIDDFKAGRLDKIKELIEKDERAKDLVNINITIINNNNYPLKPWLWVYQVKPVYYPINTCQNSTSTNIYLTNARTNCLGGGGGGSVSGQTCANFTGGTYNLTGGQIINL